jgi:hypothetical protein
MLTLCAFLLVSCGKPEEKFLGRWTDGHGRFLDFAQDGKLVIDDSRAATWSVINSHRIEFQTKVLFGEVAGSGCLEDGILKMHTGAVAANYIPAGANGTINLETLQRAVHTPTGCSNN